MLFKGTERRRVSKLQDCSFDDAQEKNNDIYSMIESRDVVRQAICLNTILITAKLIRSILGAKGILNSDKTVILIN